MASLAHVIEKYLARLRPESFDELIGQDRLTETLERLVRQAHKGEHPFPPVLLVGPRGVGKKSVASALANELADETSGLHEFLPGTPADTDEARERLEEIQPGDIVVLEQLHEFDEKIRRQFLEAARQSPDESGPEQTELTSFTVIGLTDSAKAGDLSPVWNPVRVRDYNTEELVEIADWSAGRLGLELTEDAAFRLARHSRGHARWLKVTLVRLLLERVDIIDERDDWVVEDWMVDEVVD